jgi:hypothetical protein
MPGAGFCPAGFSPAGWGSLTPASVNSPLPLPDPHTGLSLTGRLLNYQQGGSDYVFTPDGRVSGMRTMQQLVLIALLNANIFSNIGTQGPNIQRLVAGRVQSALNPFLKQKWIALVRCDVASGSSNPNALAVDVVWRDLTMPAPTSSAQGAPNVFTTSLPTT